MNTVALVKAAEAGRRGKDVRSDLWVRVAPRQAGGIDLNLESRVALYYGEALRQQIVGVLTRLGVAHATVEVDDAGALPFTVEARVECAVRRALDDTTPGAPIPSPGPAGPERPRSPRARLRRSRLYLPGNEPKFMANAGLHAADGIILDLEDSVAPAEKDSARLLVRYALGGLDFKSAERMVRINQLPLGLSDLNLVVPMAPDLILLPKCESADQVRQVDEHILSIQKTLGLSGEVWIMPILESPLGIQRAHEIGSSSPRIVALTIGLEDYTAELGVTRTVGGAESLWARQALVNAARAAGLQPIDSVYSDVADAEGLRRSALEARSFGFEGKGCIHPAQIRIINEAFAPTAKEIDWALRVVAAFEDARKRGLGVVSLGTKMIDAPVVHRAERTVRAAAALGLLPAPSDRAAADEGRRDP
ncbi:MAG: citrate lyase subunit gamma [Candidatus Riflebacteria bacterium]|nr:citrate lyase subunit gamma [Candidatus Riflebacteria bacterium]